MEEERYEQIIKTLQYVRFKRICMSGRTDRIIFPDDIEEILTVGKEFLPDITIDDIQWYVVYYLTKKGYSQEIIQGFKYYE